MLQVARKATSQEQNHTMNHFYRMKITLEIVRSIPFSFQVNKRIALTTELLKFARLAGDKPGKVPRLLSA